MRTFAILTLLLFSVSLVQAQSGLVDVIYLHDGSVVRGTITEMIPGQSVRIQTADGSIFVFDMARVQRMTREAPQASAPQAPTAQAPPSAPVPQPSPAYGVPPQPAYGTPPSYGGPQSGYGPSQSFKEPSTGMLFGALVPGGGHFYAGETGKGVMLLGATAASFIVPGLLVSNEVDNCYDDYDYDDCYDAASNITTIAYVSYAAALGVWAYSIFDGKNAVERHNRRLAGAGPQFSMGITPNRVGGTTYAALNASVSF